MKKGTKIVLIILAIIVIAVAAFFIIRLTKTASADYEIVKVENYNYFLLKQESGYGVIDKEGKVVVEAKYSQVAIPNPEKDVFVCYDNNQSIVLNSKGEKIYTNFEQIEPIHLKNVSSDLMYEKSTLTYCKNNKYGLINLKGEKITDNIYDNIENLTFKEGELLVKSQGKIGVININGYQLVPCQYDKIDVDNYYEEENGYRYAGYIVSNTTNEGYRYGYINYLGEEICACEYNDLERVVTIKETSEAYLILAKNGKYGVYKNQNEVIKNEYQSIRYEEENEVFVVEKNKKYGVMSKNGNEILPIEYDQIDITGVYIYAEKNDETIVYDANGEKAEIESTTSILNTGNEKYKIKITTDNGLYGVIDNNGKNVIPQEYNYIEYLYDDYFIVSNKENKLGVLNSKGEEKIQIQYNSLQKIQGTKIIQTSITTTQTSEFYSSDLQKIFEVTGAAVEVSNGYVFVKNDKETKYISVQTQKEVNNKEVYKNNNIFAKEENGKWGFENKEGKIVVNCEYDKVTEVNKYGFAGIKKDGKWGVIDKDGKIIVTPKYEIKNESKLNFIGEYYSIEYGFGEIYYTK